MDVADLGCRTRRGEVSFSNTRGFIANYLAEGEVRLKGKPNEEVRIGKPTWWMEGTGDNWRMCGSGIGDIDGFVVTAAGNSAVSHRPPILHQPEKHGVNLD